MCNPPPTHGISDSPLARTAVQEADQTGALVQELNTAVSRIGDVVGLISTIAGKTNLLALNATIEKLRGPVRQAAALQWSLRR